MQNGYWFRMYGTQPDDFIEGVIAGITMFAIWKNGKQVVGIMEHPLEEVIKEVKEQLSYKQKGGIDK